MVNIYSLLDVLSSHSEKVIQSGITVCKVLLHLE